MYYCDNTIQLHLQKLIKFAWDGGSTGKVAYKTPYAPITMLLAFSADCCLSITYTM